jgi:hypothetical protein
MRIKHLPIIAALLFPIANAHAVPTAAALPQLPATVAAQADWLVSPVSATAECYQGAAPEELILSNGIISRTFRIAPNAATIRMEDLRRNASLLRGVKPEAVVVVDGTSNDIGGLVGQEDYAYLKPEWLQNMTSPPGAFQCTGFEVRETSSRFPASTLGNTPLGAWHPKGVALVLHFAPPADGPKGLHIDVHYELYDGMPVLSKWLEIKNSGNATVRISSFTTELLAVVEDESIVDVPTTFNPPQSIQVESDYAFKGSDAATANRVVHWVPDPEYTTQVNYRLAAPLQLECRPPLGPDVALQPGESMETFRIFELIHDTTDRERRGLAQRRMYRALCPWVQENPVLLHLTSSNANAIRQGIDQSAEVGAEMVIMSFGSGFNMEHDAQAYLDEVKGHVDYAHSKGIKLGGYSLLASRRISDEHDVINPKTGKIGGAIFDNSPCLESKWGHEYFEKLRHFIEYTGVDVLEHDGSYPGDVCASTTHPGHRGLEDSQWQQWRRITEFYRWCRGRGVYLNVPDWYFMNGSSKTAMGYREVNWSLPRERQIVLGRQNIFDGTWGKSPSMGWMFVPMVQYHGGGAAATLEPLHEHLADFEAHLVQNFGAGVQACYRGTRWYDTDDTKALVTKWIAWFKQYREVLQGDIIHVRRADGRQLDAILHVNPFGAPRGLLMVYNPASIEQSETLRVPLYYTGLESVAKIRQGESPAAEFPIARDYSVALPLNVPANSAQWHVIE